MKKKTIGKVVRILDRYRIIIDAGASSLKVGDFVEVFSLGEGITDSEGNDLGPFVQIKDKLQVIQTEDLYSICEKKDVVTVSKSPISELITSPLLKDSIKTQRVPLNVDNEVIETLPKLDPKIIIGDLIRKA